MAGYIVYALGESHITVSGGEQLSGFSQGDGSHLVGETITLNSNAWEAMGIDDSDTKFDDSDNSQSLNGAQTFDGTSYSGSERVEAEYELTLQDPDGNTYKVLGFNINESGSAYNSYGTVEGLAFVGGVGGFPPVGVPLTVVSAKEGPSRPYADLATPPCFTAGSMIATPSGLVAVEDLTPGDMVETLDHGPQPLRWVGVLRVPAAVLRHDLRFRPVCVRRDAFGPGQPCRDTWLSQQHRVLVSDWRAELFFGEDEVLVPVKKLTNDSTIHTDSALQDVTYVHLLFDQHEIVTVDGLASESFFPDATARAICPTQEELAMMFPQLAVAPADALTARACIHDRRACVLQ